MRCLNQEPHNAHKYLADSDAVMMSECPGLPRLYTEEEVAALQDSEVRIVLKGLLRTLESVKAQRGAADPRSPLWAQERRRGECWGLDLAIRAVHRRLGR